MAGSGHDGSGQEISAGIVWSEAGRLSISVGSVAEAKLGIKSLRIKKKELGLEKRQITAAMSALRGEQRMKSADQGSVMRGGGKLGRTVRAFQGISRDADRQRHVSQLAPYETAKARIEDQLQVIDNGIIALERYVLQRAQ